MQVQIDFWQLLLAIAGLVAAFGSVVWIFGAALIRQFEKRLGERFDAIEEARRNAGKILQQDMATFKNMEREFLEFKASMPLQYVRREDYIRGQSVIEAKLDALYSKLETLLIQGSRK